MMRSSFKKLKMQSSTPMPLWELHVARFLGLLETLIKETPHLQNSVHLTPKEEVVARHVVAALQPFITADVIRMEKWEHSAGRPNLKFVYNAKAAPNGVVTFAGAHLDVVPVDQSQWTHDPYNLTIEGDRLYGRGTTDCLGHVALLTELCLQLAENRPPLDFAVVFVFISDEEYGDDPKIGIQGMMESGMLSEIQRGPVYWVDTADCQPCIGCGSVLTWKLSVMGKTGHSGFPHKSINAILLAMEVVKKMMDAFHDKFGAHPQEAKYGYHIPSTMKPTQWGMPESTSVNQIPGEAWVVGDVRATPFWDVEEVMRFLDEFVDKEINAKLDGFDTLGPQMGFSLENGQRGEVQLEWLGHVSRGIACNMDSLGYRAMEHATQEVFEVCSPFSVTGSLPLVASLVDSGHDVQLIGWGVMDVYHANDEYALLSNFKNGFKVCTNVLEFIGNHGSTKL